MPLLTARVPASYSATCSSLHAVAEHVLAAALHQATGRIGLRTTPGGFGTPTFTHDGVERQVRVEGVDLVVVEDGEARRTPLLTIGQAAGVVGIEAGAPASVYPPTTPLEAAAPLNVDPEAASVVYEWFHLTGAALDQLRDAHAALQPPVAQLWPEHFDLAIVMDDVNYGGSPGDELHRLPYAYVGPWDDEHLDDGYWNEPFGASLPLSAVQSAADLVTFFERGFELARSR